MGRGREILCVHYQAAHQCDLGKDAEWRGLCQTCPSYKKASGRAPARKDNRRAKLDKIQKKEKWE